MAYWGVTARNDGQKAAMRALANDKPLVFLTGPAGTGKTLITQAVGLSRLMDDHDYQKFVYTRLQTQLGADLGFLPGDIDEKTYPFVRPFLDNLDVMSGSKKEQVLQYITAGDDKRRKVFFDPIQTLRGGSLHRQYVMVDESQNIDAHTICGVGTRLASGSKFVFLGNFAQIDNESLRRPERNGLYRLLSGLYERDAHEYFDHVNLTQVERHPVAGLIESILRDNEMAAEFAELEAKGNVN